MSSTEDHHAALEEYRVLRKKIVTTSFLVGVAAFSLANFMLRPSYGHVGDLAEIGIWVMAGIAAVAAYWAALVMLAVVFAGKAKARASVALKALQTAHS